MNFTQTLIAQTLTPNGFHYSYMVEPIAIAQPSKVEIPTLFSNCDLDYLVFGGT